MKDQKDWINNIDDNIINELIEQKNDLPKVPSNINTNLMKSLRNEAEKIHKKNKEKKIIEFPRFSMPLRIAFSAAMIFIVLLTGTVIFINYYNRSNMINIKSVLLSGDVSAESKELKIDEKIYQNKIIKTRSSSICRIRIENNSVIQMEENTAISWNYKHAKKEKIINIDLVSGKILVSVKKLPENTLFQVNTADDTITVRGTQFYVDYNPDKDKPLTVAVTEGKVEVKDKKNNKKISLNTNEMIIKNYNKTEKNQVSKDIKNKLSILNNIKLEKNKKIYKLYIKTPEKIKIIKINNDSYQNTNKELDIIVNKNKMNLTLINEKNKILYNKKITLQKKETYLEINENELLKTEDTNKNETNNIVEDNTADNENKKWTGKQINKLKIPDKENIITITSNKKIIIAQTKSSLYCLNKDGKIIWNKSYGKEKNIYFMSPPFIIKNKIYISSINNKMLILNSNSGKELEVIDTQNNNISFGYKSIMNNNILYLPFTNGLYSIYTDGVSYIIDEEIPFSSPTTPLFIKDKIILTSYTNKIISCFDTNKNEEWNYEFDNRIFSSPIALNNKIYLIDIKGILYTFTINGEILNKMMLLDNGFNSIISINKNIIYLLSNDGALYSYNINDKNKKKLFQVDNMPKVNKYLQKSAYIHNDKLFIGTDSGEIIIYDINNQKIEEKIKLSNTPIMSTVFHINNTYYIGTESGEIFSLKK